MNKLKNTILSALFYLFLLVAFILIVSFANAIRKGDVPTLFNRAVFIVLTPSMEDVLNEGDMIFVDTEPDILTVGDIITFRKPDEPNMIITHRIVEINDVDGVRLYTTKGDANDISGDWETNFQEDYIIGKYLSKSAIIGNIYSFVFAGGISVIFIAIIIIFVTIGGMELFNIINTLSSTKKKEQLEEKERMIKEELERLRKAKQEEED